MHNKMLISFKNKHTDTFIEQTKTKPQERLEGKVNKQKHADSAIRAGYVTTL